MNEETAVVKDESDAIAMSAPLGLNEVVACPKRAAISALVCELSTRVICSAGHSELLWLSAWDFTVACTQHTVLKRLFWPTLVS